MKTNDESEAYQERHLYAALIIGFVFGGALIGCMASSCTTYVEQTKAAKIGAGRFIIDPKTGRESYEYLAATPPATALIKALEKVRKMVQPHLEDEAEDIDLAKTFNIWEACDSAIKRANQPQHMHAPRDARCAGCKLRG